MSVDQISGGMKLESVKTEWRNATLVSLPSPSGVIARRYKCNSLTPRMVHSRRTTLDGSDGGEESYGLARSTQKSSRLVDDSAEQFLRTLAKDSAQISPHAFISTHLGSHVGLALKAGAEHPVRLGISEASEAGDLHIRLSRWRARVRRNGAGKRLW